MRGFSIGVAILLSAAGYAGPPRAPIPGLKLPVVFEENAGQTDPAVKYLARGNNSTLWLTGDGAVLGLHKKSGDAYLKLRFEGGNRSAAIAAEDPTGGASNYFIGKDPARWRTNVRQYGKVRYRGLYPGIDVLFYGNPDQLEYDFVLHPGADPSKIRLAFEGARGLRANASGDLVIGLANGEVVAHAPVIRQGAKTISGHYVVHGKRAGFAIDAYDRSAELVIDPILTYATFLGGNIGDQAYGVALDKQGNIFVAGETSSLNFPTKNALFTALTATVNNPAHAFLAKINPAASGAPSLVFSTLFGSDGSDQANAVAVDASGNPMVAGITSDLGDNSLPQMHPLQSLPHKTQGCGNVQIQAYCGSAFVARFSSSGNALLLSSYLTGSDQDGAQALMVDASGNAWVAGYTTSLDFPVRGQPFQSTLHGMQGGFVSEISAAGSLVYSTYFNGQSSTEFNALTVDASGNVYAAGETTSSGLATPGAYQTLYPGVDSAIVAEFSPANGLVYCTYLGGSKGTTVADGVGIDSSGKIYVGGGTNATDFPVSPSAFRSTLSDLIGNFASEGFLTKLNPAATGSAQLVYSTLFGCSGDDVISALAVDPAGHVTVAGETDSPDFPATLNGFQCCWAGYLSANFITSYGFVTRFDPTQSGDAGILYSTLLGGSIYTQLSAIALDSTGNTVVVAGTVESTDTPVTPSAAQTTFGGQSSNSQYLTDYGDAYIARFDFSQTGPVAPVFLNGAALDANALPSIAPGLIFTLKGVGLGPAIYSLAQLDPNTGLIATKVQGVQVFVNGIACALTYVSSTQINAIAPYELAKSVGGFAQVQAFYNGVPGTLSLVPVAATAPGILSLDDGTGQGVIINQDGSLNGPNNPAAIGSTITIYGTGEGQTNPPGIDGGVANNLNALPHPVAPLAVSIGTVNTQTPSYAGTAPEEIYGLLQVNVTVPNGVAPGAAVPVTLTIGGVASQKGLTMAVKAQ